MLEALGAILSQRGGIDDGSEPDILPHRSKRLVDVLVEREVRQAGKPVVLVKPDA